MDPRVKLSQRKPKTVLVILAARDAVEFVASLDEEAQVVSELDELVIVALRKPAV